MGHLLKSVHLTNYYHKNSGGISTSFNNLMAAAERHRRLVRLIVPGESEAVEDVNEFAKIYYVPAKYSPIFDKRYRLITPFQYIPGDSIIRKILKAEMPDLIEVTDKYTLSMLGAMVRIGKFKQLNRPILVHFSCERMDDNIGSYLSTGKAARWFARRIIGNYTFPTFDYHIANSVYTAEEFYRSVEKAENPGRSKWFFNRCWRFFNAPRIDISDRIFVCPRGVNAELFTPERRSDSVRESMRAAAGIPAESVMLLYAGRLAPEKNVGLLKEIMRILAADNSRDYRLLIAGDGPESEQLRDFAEKEVPGKMILLGHLEKETLADYYANADVFIHPNPREPFGIAPLEAMASGVPTVAPNAGGILSYATNENAWLVEPNGADFAAAVREILENSDARNAKIEKARAAALANTREISTDRLFAAYDKMYEDFHLRRELFTDAEAARQFDYSEIV